MNAQAAITKCHREGGLNNRQLFLTVLEAGKSEISVPVQLGSVESPLPGFQMTAFLLYPHKPEKERASSLVSSYKGTNLIMRTLMS